MFLYSSISMSDIVHTLDTLVSFGKNSVIMHVQEESKSFILMDKCMVFYTKISRMSWVQCQRRILTNKKESEVPTIIC